MPTKRTLLHDIQDDKGQHYGYAFPCPGCKSVHQINDQESVSIGPKWDFNGNMDAPTFSPSLKVTHRHPKGYDNDHPAPADFDGEYVEDVCHSFITDGKIQFLDDCYHELAGQTVPMQTWEEYDAASPATD